MRVVGGLVEEQILHDNAFHRCQAGRDVMRVGVGLQDVLTLDVDAAIGAVDRRVEHVVDAHPRLGFEMDAPVFLEHFAGRGVGDMAVARQLVRERAHVARALHVVLAAQRVHSGAALADIAGDHRKVRHRP